LMVDGMLEQKCIPVPWTVRFLFKYQEAIRSQSEELKGLLKKMRSDLKIMPKKSPIYMDRYYNKSDYTAIVVFFYADRRSRILTNGSDNAKDKITDYVKENLVENGLDPLDLFINGVACRLVLSPTPSCILIGLVVCSLYVILLGLFATRKLRLTEYVQSDFTYDIEPILGVQSSAVCQTFHLRQHDWNTTDQSRVQPPKCDERGILSNTNPTYLYDISITNGQLNIRKRSVRENQTTDGDIQCSLFPIIRSDEYHSIYGIPVNSVQDGYRPDWPAFMVLCQPRENLIQLPQARWNSEKLKQQERHFVCGAFPPVHLDTTHAKHGPMFNVLLLGLDSISRVAAEQYLPQTMAWLRSHRNVEIMDLYNIIGDGTTANLLALLTGLFEHELPESRKSRVVPVSVNSLTPNETVLDTYPWLWGEFNRVGGYATHFIEDSPKWGTFQHRLTGFGVERTPTHSYGRPCLLMAAQEEHRYGKTLGCIHARYTHHMLLESTTEFFLAYKDRPRFSLTFLSEMIHENSAYVSILDSDVARFLDKIHKDDVLSNSHVRMDKAEHVFANTLVILFADHGPRMGSARLSAQGKMNERLPLLSFILPQRLIRAWPKAREALHRNRERLTTLFDVHMTLRHLLHWQTHKSDTRVSSVPKPAVSRGSSLFVELPVHRSCAEAHILPQWCTCLNWYPIRARSSWSTHIFCSLWPSWIEEAARTVVSSINAQLDAVRRLDPGELRCSRLYFRELVSAEQALPSRELMRFVRSLDVDGRIPQYMREDDQAAIGEGWTADSRESVAPLLRLVIRTGPGPGSQHFEAIVQIRLNSKRQREFVLSTVNRLDQYEPRAGCLPSAKWPEIRPFCVCPPNGNDVDRDIA
uniref:Guanylate cyclase domain-containing protein n=1 Tax=Echinostoma caproni TaxID=27848 RepID=A0A183A823_9TREM